MSEKSRPKILLVKPVLPYPPNQGTRVASFSLIKALRSGFDVTVLARILSREEERDARELEKWCARVVTVMAPNRKSLLHRVAYKFFYYFKSVFLHRSLKGLYDCPGAFLRAARALSREHFDLVVIEYWQLQRVARYFPPNRCVLLTHDVDMFVNWQVTLLEKFLPRKIDALRRWLVERREEVAAYRGSRRIWTLTERDRDAVRKVGGGKPEVEVLPIGVDLDFFAPPGMERNPGEVLFLGHLAASFNRDALVFFASEVYPRLKNLDGVSITIVGGPLPRELEPFGLQPEVEVVGRVSDVRPYLHRASCIVIPLRFGGGLRIRILEAMSAGIPVVCTSVAIAGMQFEPRTDYLLADEPEEMAEAVERVLRDEALARALAGSAMRRVRELYASGRQERLAAELVTRVISSS